MHDNLSEQLFNDNNKLVINLVMFITILRFYEKGWISELYVDPSYHFSFLRLASFKSGPRPLIICL